MKIKNILGASALLLAGVSTINAQCDISGLNPSYCAGDAPVTIGTPGTGYFVGTGVSGSSFEPTNAGAGAHTVVHTDWTYVVDQTGTFAPASITGTQVSLGDDQVSGALPIGFSFNFYGINYTEFYISSNGFITFSAGQPSGCCSGQNIPNAATPNNLIALAWEDLDPGNGGQPAENVVRYETIGTAPNRILVVEYFNVDHFSNGNNVTTQAMLYETSNVIEIHTTTMPTNGDIHTMGVENINGTQAVAAPGRNANGTWSATNDYTAFIPQFTFYCTQDVTVYSITDESVAASANTFCDSGSTVINTGASQNGMFYYLRDNSNNSIIDGPLAGDGSALGFNTGMVYTTTDYNVFAQAGLTPSHSMEFGGNGSGDEVNLGNTINSVIGGTNTFTAEAWINPDGSPSFNTVVGNYDGGMQFLLRITNGFIEFYIDNGSFQNVLGSTPVPAGSWSHVAGTWDGINLRVYLNGVLDGTSVATGLFNTTTTNDVSIGGGLSNGTEYFDGKITDVRLWSDARSEGDINANMDNCLSGTEAGLLAWYGMHEGTGSSTVEDLSGNGYVGTLTNMDVNTAWSTDMPTINCVTCEQQMSTVETLTILNSTTSTIAESVCTSYTVPSGDETYTVAGTYTDTIANAAGCDSLITINLTILANTGIDTQTACDSLQWIDGTTYYANNTTATHVLTNAAGCDSTVTLNLTIVTPTTGTDTQTACDSYMWIDGNTYTTNNNTATFVLTNAAGCDSTVTLDLTITNVDSSVTTSGFTITAVETGATYQWIDCDNGNAAIAGETGQSFTATDNGNYAVIVTAGGCADTSECISITGIGVDELVFNGIVNVYPNPTNGLVNIALDANYDDLTVVIRNAVGQEVYRDNPVSTNQIQFELDEAPGAYFVQISDAKGRTTQVVLVKE